jgi:hypothetical protein
MSLLKYVTIVNQNGESSKSTKRKTTDQQEKIKEYEKNQETRNFLPKWAVGMPWLRDKANGMVCTWCQKHCNESDERNNKFLKGCTCTSYKAHHEKSVT